MLSLLFATLISFEIHSGANLYTKYWGSGDPFYSPYSVSANTGAGSLSVDTDTDEVSFYLPFTVTQTPIDVFTNTPLLPPTGYEWLVHGGYFTAEGTAIYADGRAPEDAETTIPEDALFIKFGPIQGVYENGQTFDWIGGGPSFAPFGGPGGQLVYGNGLLYLYLSNGPTGGPYIETYEGLGLQVTTPEPSSLALLGLSAITLLGRFRQRHPV